MVALINNRKNLAGGESPDFKSAKVIPCAKVFIAVPDAVCRVMDNTRQDRIDQPACIIPEVKPYP